LEYVFLLAFVVSVCIYLTDRKGWNATAKRLSTIARAHIESAKPLKQIEKQSEKLALDTWTAQFEGKAIESGPKHVIVRTWFARVGGSVSPHFKCKCGHTDWHVNVDAAARLSKSHVNEQNRAEELMKRNGGTHAW
jgi:hypothetical protein